jgi:serine/threonine protein phosphatase PrpC
MGGYNAGEVASGMATTLLGTELEGLPKMPPQARTLPASCTRTGSSIRRDRPGQQRRSTRRRKASRNTPAWARRWWRRCFYDNMMTVAHIGDSRLYRLRGGEFQVMTRDHSLLQEQIDSGMITAEEARHSQNKNLVTRALGVDPVVEPEIHDYDTMPGDVYLLCSDGLNDMVEDEEIALTLQALSGQPGPGSDAADPDGERQRRS